MTDLLNILLVEDNPEDELLIREYLQSTGARFELHVAERLDDGIEALARQSFHVVLLDLALPDSTGLKTFASMHLAAGAIPIVVLTALDDEDIGLRAVQAGAEDYLVKGQIHGTLLWRSLRYAVERRRAARRIEFQAQLLEQVGQAVVAVDTDGLIQYWNAAATDLFGWTPAEVIGMPLRMIVPIEEGPEGEAEAAARSATDPWIGELHVRRRDGTRLLVGATLSMLRDARGAVIGRIGISTDVTERRRAETALRESEQRLRLFVDVMPTIMWTTDTQLRITSIAGAALKHAGGDASNAIGGDISEYATSPGAPESAKALEGAAVSTTAEWNGRSFDVHIEPLRDQDGTITGTIGIALDVTDRRRSEREAAQYFELLRTIVESAPVAIVVLDEDGKVSLWNRSAERMFGWHSSEVMGRSPPHVPAEARTDFELNRRRVRYGGKAQRIGGRRVTKDGRVLDVVVTVSPIYGADGHYHGTMGIVEDVTQQRLSEERQQRLNAIIEASPDFVATFDVERRTLFVNQAGREMLGLEPGIDVRDTTMDQFCSADTVETLERSALPRALAEGTWSGEAVLRTVSGEELLAWLTIVAHRGSDGDLAFISAVGQDISQRRFLEEQLRQSQKMEAVGRLAGGVAHDFNNLLTAIAGHTELLLEDLGEDAEIRGDIEEVLHAVDRASALTRQLLAFSRRQVLQPKLLDVNQVISDLGRLLRRLIGPDVRLDTVLHTEVGRVRADHGQIEQVLMNLVVNARDALPQGGVVELRTTLVEVSEDSAEHRQGVKPGSYVEIAVTDNGIGMSAAVVSRIFEPFFTTKEQGKGTGLGLPTVFGIVSQSGGHVLVESEPGAGSTFRVLLPRVDDAFDDEMEVVVANQDIGGSETVLLVEDEAAVRRLGCRILERRGYNVVEAESGAAALRLFERLAPGIAVLVTDVVMPEMSGSELARRLRAMKPSLPVLFTSGYAADAIAQNGELGAHTAFLEKPFTPDALAQKVRDLLDERSA
ncbi:MAG TPA: PAS domain S-box protein [Longimicrobiales bacterium]|nr:PAS domain S-box protein [Longimicrobiales bacterium]